MAKDPKRMARVNEFWHTIYHAPDFQVSNFGNIRPTVRLTHSEHNYKARLTYEQVILLKHLRRKGVSLGILAAKFGMSKPGIVNICNGRRWKDVAHV